MANRYKKAPALVGSAALALAVLTASAPASAAPLPPTRDPVAWPFAATSPWNTPIGSNVKYAATPDACTRGVSSTADGTDLNMSQWSVPIYRVSSSTRAITIFNRNNDRSYASRLGVGAKPSAPSWGDRELAILNTSTLVSDETYQTTISDPRARVTAVDYARYHLKGPGIGAPIQGDRQGIRAYGGSAIAGLIRRGELVNGIHHALAFSLPSHRQRSGWVWPAVGQDSAPHGYAGSVPIGQLAFIPNATWANISRYGLSKYGLKIAAALHYYGAYDVDSSSDFSLYAEPAVVADIGSAGHDTVAYRDIPILASLLRCVTNNTSRTVGGGGTYPAALKPPPFSR